MLDRTRPPTKIAGASPEPGGHVQDVGEQHHLGSRRSLGAGSEHPAPADLAGDGPNAEGGQARRAVGGSEQGQPRTGRRQGQQQVAKAREGERRPIWQWLGISRPGLVGPTELPESKESLKLKDLCLAMSRLLLRHEDAQSIARIMKAAEVWKKAKAEMPETLTMPLRVAMLHSMLQIWHERMKVTMQSPESIANAKEMLILDGDCRVPYLQYNAQEKKMMIKTDRAPMEFQEVLTALETLQTLTILPLTVLRFHSTRRMEQDLKGETLANGPGDWAADGGSGSGMVPLQSAMPLGSMPSHGDVDESRQARQIGSGHLSAEDDRKHVRTLVLGNRRNYCYSNASFLALLWTQASIPSGLETAEHLLGSPLFSLWSRLRKLRPSITQHLWQQLPWRTPHRLE